MNSTYTQTAAGTGRNETPIVCRSPQLPQIQVIEPVQPVFGYQPEKLRVCAYARVSSDSDDQLNSFAAQVDYYTEHITGNDEWDLVDIYAEIIVPYMIRLRFRDFVKECKNLLIYRLSHTEGCAKVLFFCPLFSTDYFERVQLSVHDGNFAHPYNDEAVP